MSTPLAQTGRPPLRLILGGQGAPSLQPVSGGGSESTLDTPSSSARALLALAPHAKGRRYWLIDPLPTVWEVAAGAPLTIDRLRHLRLAAEALARQVREDDGVARAIIAALERQLRDADLTVAEVASALRAVGDSDRAWQLVEELRSQQTTVLVSPRL